MYKIHFICLNASFHYLIEQDVVHHNPDITTPTAVLATLQDSANSNILNSLVMPTKYPAYFVIEGLRYKPEGCGFKTR
jgi:hypothetical protein